MEKIVKLIKRNYKFDDNATILEAYFQDLASKPNISDNFGDYTLKQLRAKTVDREFLFILRTYVDRCPNEAFEKHGSNWIQLLIRNGSGYADLLGSIFAIIRQIVYNIALHNYKKELDSKAIEKIIDTCIQSSTTSCLPESLDCLDEVMRSFPEHCSFVWQKVNKYLLTHVDCPSEATSHKIGLCLLSLYQVKGGSVKAGTLEQSWAVLQNGLLKNLHNTVNAIIEADDFSDVKLQDQAIALDVVEDKPILCQRLLNLLNYLGTALIQPIASPKPISVGKIVDFIFKMIEENSPIFSNKSFERDVTIGPFLHKIHEELLELTGHLITALKGNLILFNKTICGLLRVALKRVSRAGQIPYMHNYKSQKLLTYKLIREWVQISRGGSDVENLITKTIEQIFKDTKTFEADINSRTDPKLQLMTEEKKSSRKRKRNKSGSEAPPSVQKSSSLGNMKDDCEIVSHGLRCLNDILSLFGHSMNAKLHNSVMTSIHIFAKKLLDFSILEGLVIRAYTFNLHEDICKVLITFNSSSHHLHRSSMNYTMSILDMFKSFQPHNRAMCQAFNNYLVTIFHYPRTPFHMANPSSSLLQLPTQEESNADPEYLNDDSDIEMETLLMESEDDGENVISSTVASVQDEKPLEVAAESHNSPINVEDEDEKVPDTVESISSGCNDDDREDVMEVIDLEGETNIPPSAPSNKNEGEQEKASICKEETKVPAKMNDADKVDLDDIMCEFIDELI